ncbi:MAG: hypothetical protein JXR95_14480 [Deltaproteobacteria bacterium]|nr:hypothetical protein [Deltaproteobacteria bacterium]
MLLSEFPIVTDEEIPAKRTWDHELEWNIGYPMYIIIQADRDCAEIKKGTRGRIRTSYGTSMYNWHNEVPLNGWGIPIEHVSVVERTEDGEIINTPYLEWLKYTNTFVSCPKCKKDLREVAFKPCEVEVRIRTDIKVKKIEEHERKEERKLHGEKIGRITIPVLDYEPEGFRGLEYGPLKRMLKKASEYELDFEGIVLYMNNKKRGTLMAAKPRDPDDSIANNHIEQIYIDLDSLDTLDDLKSYTLEELRNIFKKPKKKKPVNPEGPVTLNIKDILNIHEEPIKKTDKKVKKKRKFSLMRIIKQLFKSKQNIK